MPTMSLSTIVRANYKAVSLMCDTKDFESAYGLLNQAIAALEVQFDETLNQAGETVPPSSPISGALAPIRCPETINNSGFSVYPHAMTLLQDQLAPTEEACNTLYAIMLYNSALCLHLYGLRTGRDSTLKRSVDAYELALGLLGDLGREPFVFVLELAIQNNLANVYSCLFRVQDVHAILRLMKNTLCEITNGWTREIPKQVSPFCSNVLMNANHFARPAPAA